MWDIPRLYASACSNSVQLVPLHPIVMSILFHHPIELKECISEVERIDRDTITNSMDKELTIKEEGEAEKEEESSTTLDSTFR
jgi:hypothetical protein